MIINRLILLSLLSVSSASAGNSVSGDVDIDVHVTGAMVSKNGKSLIGVVTDSAVSGSVSISAVVEGSVVTNDGETSIACVNNWSGGNVKIEVFISSVINQGAGKIRIGCQE